MSVRPSAVIVDVVVIRATMNTTDCCCNRGYYGKFCSKSIVVIVDPPRRGTMTLFRSYSYFKFKI